MLFFGHNFDFLNNIINNIIIIIIIIIIKSRDTVEALLIEIQNGDKSGYSYREHSFAK